MDGHAQPGRVCKRQPRERHRHLNRQVPHARQHRSTCGTTQERSGMELRERTSGIPWQSGRRSWKDVPGGREADSDGHAQGRGLRATR